MQIVNSVEETAALKKHAPIFLREIGVTETINDYEPRNILWSDLTKHGKSAMTRTKQLTSEMQGKTEREVGQIEDACHILMNFHDEVESEKDLRTAIGSRAKRGPEPERDWSRVPAVYDAESKNSFSCDEPETVGLTRGMKMSDFVRSHGADEINISPGGYLRAMVLGAKSDEEKRALAEGTDSAGGFTVPDILSSNFIDLMRSASVTIAAGARTIPLTSDQNFIAKVSSDPTPAWRAENAAVAEADPTFTRVALQPKSLAVLVKVSRELLEDSLNMETLLPQILTSAMAIELDRVALFGSGTDPEPLGLVNTVGVDEIAHNAILANYIPLVRSRTNILTANAPGVSAFIMHPRDEGVLAETLDSTGQPLIIPPKIADIPMLTTTSVPVNGGAGSDESTIIAGDFSKMLIGIRHDIRIEVLKERYADSGQFAFIAFLRADIALEHPTAFSKITGILPTP